MIIPVVITVFSDRSFTFIMKTPPASRAPQEGCGPADRQEAGLRLEGAEQEQGRQGHRASSSASSPQLKMQDMNATDIEAAMRTIAGTARSMGVDVVD